MKTIARTCLTVPLVMALIGASVFAGKFNAALSIDDAAPKFEILPGVDGQQHSFDDFSDAQLLVLVFTSCQSPCATKYEQRLVQVEEDYGSRRVQLVAVSVSRSEADSLQKMKERAKKAGFLFPYLQDASQQVGRRFGATTTPQVFVLDAKRRVRYMGRIDDQPDDVDVQKPYLRQALDALLDSRDPPTLETRPEGCRIKYQ